jgi:transposase-like protein
MGFCAVGRKYGVSDNAVRKWLRSYEYESETEARADPPAESRAPPPDTIAA